MSEGDEIESVVAAVVWRLGPVSAYGVREEFRQSLTRAWSSSAGTIYPVIDRLLKKRQLKATPQRDGRGTKLLQITALGRKAVRKWLLTYDGPTASAAPDALRVRMQFVQLVNREDRKELFDMARAASQAVLDELVAHLESRASTNWPAFLGIVGAAMQVQARLRWLEFAETAMKQEGERECVLRARKLITNV